MLKHVEFKEKKNLFLYILRLPLSKTRVQRPMKNSYHICGEIRHKIINCPKLNDMHNMSKNKGMKTTQK